MGYERSIRVVRCGVGDAGRVGPLFDAYREFYGRPSDPEGAVRFLEERLRRGESVVFLAEEDREEGRSGHAAGFAQLYPVFTSVGLAPAWILNDLFVAPGFRRRGVGGALMEAAERHADATGAAMLSLLTARDNATAQRLYEARGWGRDERFYRYTKPLR